MALDYTVTFNGLTIGNGTNIPITKMTGLEDLPDMRSSDVDLGLADGEVAGLDWLKGRDVVIEFLVLDSGSGDYFTTIQAVAAAFTKGAAESTLTFQLPGRASRSIICRCRRRSIPVQKEYSYRYGQGAVELHATDPRIYDTAVSSASAPVYVAGSAGWDATAGSGVDAGWDTTAGSGVDAGWDATAGLSGGGLTVCINSGTVNAYPVMTFSAPAGMSAWTVTNQTTGQVFTMAQTINPGETLIADMTIAAIGKPGLPISVGGASRYASWQPPRTPFYLAPGSNVIRFDVSTGDPNATALLQWQNTNI